MKAAFLENLTAKARAHKAIAISALVLLVAALGAGAFWGYKQYQYRQTSAYAFEKLKAELNPPDPAALAQLVDFNALSQELALAIQKNFPFFMAGPDQERNIRHLIQTELLQRFMNKEESKPAKEESEEEMLKKDLVIFPDNFVSQLIANMQLRPVGENEALVSARIENPLLKQPFTLVFNMSKGHDGWKLRQLANANELASQMRMAMLDRFTRQRAVYVDKNSNTSKRMNDMLPIQSCTANIGALSDGKTVLMVVHVIARNKGAHQINNFNLDASINGRNGATILQRYLNVAKPVAPGEDFNHRWNFEFESNSPVAQSLLRSGPLQCKAAWQTLGVGNGQVLHIVELPNSGNPCALPDHDHPEGFCMSPVFTR